MPLYFMAAGFLLQPLSGIGAGLIRIMEEPDFLITDYVVIGGIGAATALGGVDWKLTVSTAVLAGIVSVLTSVTGLPEVK